MDKVSIGSFTVLCWGIGVLLTGALVFLGVMTIEQLLVPFITMFIVGIMLTLMATKLGFTKESIFTPKVFLAIMVSTILLVADALLLKGLIGYAVTQYDNILVAVLFAIYEECLFLGVVALFAGVGLPDFYNLLITTIIFVPLHALVYPVAIEYTIFLLIGRLIMTGAVLVTDNSDVGFGAHILYNIISTIRSVV
jgi:hypothetical protein